MFINNINREINVFPDVNQDISSHSSRLSKKLNEILSDKQSLSYFTQYLESISASSMIEFWIEVENFKKAAESLFKAQMTRKNKSLSHASINRTVSFDSSIPIQKFEERNSVNLNGFRQITKSITNLQNVKERSCSPYVHASCSDILNRNHDQLTQIDNKQELLNEAVRIFKTFIALESPHRLDLPDEIRNSIVSSICHPEGLIDPDIFGIVQKLVHAQLETQHFDNFTQSAYHCKYQIDILTGGNLTIEDIIFNQMALFYFTEYIEQEHCTVLLEFILAVVNFRDQLTSDINYDPEQAQNDAIILYDKYFSLQATSSLGFPSEVRLDIEENICREGGPLPICFHKPFRLALKVLQQYISSFLTSQLYYKYLSEMISAVEGSFQDTKRKKSSSDCSSEFSINARNTLLAMEDFPSNNKKSSKRNQATDMRIDSKQLYNGDLLWRRKTDRGLCLGRVNSLGRFESCMEPDPEKKESVIKRVVNRLVYGEKEKAREELAWQVAHMIVKDITDVTMGIPENQL